MIDERTHGLRTWGRHESFMDMAEREAEEGMKNTKTGFIAIGGGAEVKNNNVFHVNINLNISGSPSEDARATLRELVSELKILTGQPITIPKKSFWSREKK